MTDVLKTDLPSQTGAPCLVFRGSDLLRVLEETWQKSKEVCKREKKKITCGVPNDNRRGIHCVSLSKA